MYNLTPREVMELLGISKSSFYRINKDKGFPQPRTYGKRMIRYSREEILNWQASQTRN